MPDNIVHNRVGKTPLVRAEKLEEALGLERIYLKLEGNNPSGHREDRLADLIIRDALRLGKKTICVGIIDKLALSIASLSMPYGVRCVFVVPEKSKESEKSILQGPHVEIIKAKVSAKEIARHSRELALKNGWYNASPGHENNALNMTALSYISSELAASLKGRVDTVFTLMSYGFSSMGINLGFRRLWTEGQMDKLPILYSCTTDCGNVIYESYRQKSPKIIPQSSIKRKASRYNRHLINTETSIAQGALDAVYDTGGIIIALSDDELKQYVKEFKTLEKIKLHTSAGYAIAGLIKKARAGNLEQGNHVVILNDGRVDLEVRHVSRQDLKISPDKLIELVDKWLLEYSDSHQDIREALDNALDRGFLLLAYHNSELSGIGVVASLGFESFATSYHLAYIATGKKIKGRGIATEILQKAIEMTDGNLSLHVDRDNMRAIKLYEKMGFGRDYYRMIYHR